jgi:hypothetical protein
MNIFNRIIMIIKMLCIMIFAVVAMVNIFLNLFEWSTISNRVINYATSLNPFVLAAILFIVFVIALIILIFEFYRRKINLANISTDSSGKTMVTLKTLTAQIGQSLNNLQGIIVPQVKVVPRQNGIIINIFSKLASGINVADKTKEIREAASNFASQNLGFKVLQTNYTATGFVTKKAKETNKIKEEPKYVSKEEQAENKTE